MFLLLLLSLNIFGAASQRVTNKVFFDITIGGKEAGRIVFGLFGDVVPKTVANFVGLATGENNGVSSSGGTLNYKGTQIFRIIPDFLAQGGDVLKDNGSGSQSIYGEKFSDENFDIKLTKKYQLAMANAGRDTNGSQFFISLAALSWLSGKHVVFGEVMEGKDVVNKIEAVGQGGRGTPSKKVVIADCGELPMGEVAVASVESEDTSDSAEANSQDAVGGQIDRFNMQEALAYTAERHGASPYSLATKAFAVVGFAFTAYGAFRHYVK